MSLNSGFKEIAQKLLDKSVEDFIGLYNRGGGVNYSSDLQLRCITLVQ